VHGPHVGQLQGREEDTERKPSPSHAAGDMKLTPMKVFLHPSWPQLGFSVWHLSLFEVHRPHSLEVATSW
jgi:hypothetical protein